MGPGHIYGIPIIEYTLLSIFHLQPSKNQVLSTFTFVLSESTSLLLLTSYQYKLKIVNKFLDYVNLNCFSKLSH